MAVDSDTLPVGIALAPVAVGAAGFSASEIVAGSLAAAAQASIGNVVAGSAFAVLQSAGAGGAGAIVVNTVVGTTANAVAVGATAPGLVKAACKHEEECKCREEAENAVSKKETEDPKDGEDAAQRKP